MTDAPESFLVSLATPLFGPLLNDEAMARAFAAMILVRLHGEEELAKQQPLRVFDRGKEWVVMGSLQEPDKPPNSGAWFIRVRKTDCRVDRYGHYGQLEVPDEVKAFLAQEKKGREERR